VILCACGINILLGHKKRQQPYQKRLRSVGAILWVEALVVSPSMASGEMALFLLQNISGRRAGARRGFVMFLIMHIFLQQAFSSLNVSRLLPFRSNNLCIFVSALGLAPL